MQVVIRQKNEYTGSRLRTAQNLEVEVISSSVPKFEITSRWSLQIRVEEP